VNQNPSIVLGNTSAIDEGACKAYAVGKLHLFAVKKAGNIYLYQNRCPHAGLPLNWFPDKFLDRDGELIQCSSHGALFQIETGRCVAGPCPGRRLQSIDFIVDNDDNIVIQAEA
jgi:nitrite reductase/ring-hydroxylating ferredoxin subunit